MKEIKSQCHAMTLQIVQETQTLFSENAFLRFFASLSQEIVYRLPISDCKCSGSSVSSDKRTGWVRLLYQRKKFEMSSRY